MIQHHSGEDQPGTWAGKKRGHVSHALKREEEQNQVVLERGRPKEGGRESRSKERGGITPYPKKKKHPIREKKENALRGGLPGGWGRVIRRGGASFNPSTRGKRCRNEKVCFVCCKGIDCTWPSEEMPWLAGRRHLFDDLVWREKQEQARLLDGGEA